MTSHGGNAQTIVVTGGGSGIGRAVALRCAARGDSIAVIDKNGESARTTAAEALKNGAQQAVGIQCDVSSEEQVSEAFDAIGRRLGTPYGIFANAGIDRGGFIHELPPETWRAVLEVNLTGVFPTCKNALRSMLAASVAGSIVCTSSPTGFVAMAAVSPQDIPKLRTRISTEIPLGRLAEPDGPARAVAWLLSEEAAYITASHLVCDGGIAAKASISV
jgi:NAD(P)-dependent dehydrogenase (short-subunit alcohol dehydrogenase family)